MVDGKKSLPCHLIAGPLGVGKTTAILNFLKSKDGKENVAVLVNDFGANGLDGVILNGEGAPVEGELLVKPVPGGCLCCTSAVYFETHLRELSQSDGIDRIIIEPSGIVMLDQMKQLLFHLAETLELDLQPVVVLLNVARFNERHFVELPYFKMLALEADVLVGNRCDLASEEQMDAFVAYADALDSSAKRVYTTTFSRLPADAFAEGHVRPPEQRGHGHGDHIHQEKRRSGSRDWAAGICFDLERLMNGLSQWVEAHGEDEDERLKGTFNTSDGWKLVEVAQGQLYSRPFEAQDLSRVDWILAGIRGLGGPESAILNAIIDG